MSINYRQLEKLNDADRFRAMDSIREEIEEVIGRAVRPADVARAKRQLKTWERKWAEFGGQKGARQ